VRLLIDAQLPRRLASWLTSRGHDATHTLDLPDANRTTDAVISTVADAEDRIVVTKNDVSCPRISLQDNRLGYFS